MNKILGLFCGVCVVLGLATLVACLATAHARGGWVPEAEDPERPALPLEYPAFAGVGLVLLSPLFYFAGRVRTIESFR